MKSVVNGPGLSSERVRYLGEGASFIDLRINGGVPLLCRTDIHSRLPIVIVTVPLARSIHLPRPQLPIQAPIPDRFNYMCRFDFVACFQVRDGARHSQNAVVGAG